jgi:hypothetical protein
VVEIGGRQALQGVAILKDVEFRDGVVEYDLYVTGDRSYPGVYFRLAEDDFAEHFYLRPHRAGLYPDALQYAPVVAGIAEWQLYNGPGYTAPISVSEGEWIPVRLEVKGTVYISDTRSSNPRGSRIHRFRNGKFDVFVEDGIARANGLWIHDGGLLVGNSGDGFLKRVDLETGKMENVFSVGSGILDGIRVDRNGNLLVSRWGGQVFRVSPNEDMEEILDAEAQGWNTADFEYLPEENLLVIPTFFDNRVRAMRIVR